MLVTAYDEATEHRGRNNLNELKRVSPSYMRGIVVIMISESNNNAGDNNEGKVKNRKPN